MVKLRKLVPVRIWIYSFLLAGCVFILTLLFWPQFKDQKSGYLTEEEIIWLRENGEQIEVLFGYEAPPEAYHNEKGEYVGLNVDILREIERYLGVTFKIRNFSTWQEVMAYAQSQRGFVIVGIAETEECTEYLSFTDPYVKIPYVIVTRKTSGDVTLTDLSRAKVCTVQDYAVNDYLGRNYPQITPRAVSDDLQGLREVATGDCEAMVVSQAIATFVIEEQGLANLKISGESGYLNRLGVAVSVQDPVLYSIMDKTVDQIPRERQRALYRTWVSAYGEGFGLSSTVRSILVAGGMAVAGVMAVLWLWSVSLKAMVRKQTEQIQNDLDKLRAVEAALRESERRLREAQQLAQLGHWFWDVNSGAVEWSDEVYRIFRLDPEEFTPQIDSILALSPWPEDNQRDQELIQRAVESRQAGSYEQRFLRPDGSTGYYFSTFQGVYDDDGALTAITGTVQDITERKKAQEKIKESEHMYRTLVESTNSFVFSLDATGRFGFVNRFWTEKVGYSVTEIIGTNGFDLITPESRKEVEPEFAEVLRGNFVGNIEFRSKTKDKGFIDVLVNLTPIRDSSGKVTHILGTGIDITERKRAEEALRESEERFRRMADNIQDGLTIIEHDQVVYVNDRACEIFGYPRDEFVKMTGVEFAVPEEKDRLRRLRAETLRTGIKPKELEFWIVRQDGTRRYIQNRYSTSRKGGQVIGRFIFTSDITERKLAEEALRQANLVVENSPVVLFRWRAAEGWPVAMVSQNVIQFGYTPAELLSGTVPFASIVHPADLDRVAREVQEYSTSGTDRFQQEYRIVTKDGGARWVDDRTVVERNADGQIDFYQGTVIDITERKQAEEALRRSEAFLDSIIEHSPYAMWISDDKGTLLRLNQACRDMLNITDEEVVGKYNLLQDNIVEEQGLLPLVRQVFEEGKPARFQIEYDTARLDGITLQHTTSVILDTNISVVQDEHGRIENAIIQHMDITERKQAEEQLRSSEARLRYLLTATSAVLYSLRVLKDNSVMPTWVGDNIDQFGYTIEEVMTPTWWIDTLHPDDREDILPGLHRLFEQGQMVTEYRFRHKKGHYLWLRDEMALIQDEQGRPVEVVGSWIDITERKQVEEEVYRLNEELEQRVLERTAQLKAANKELEAFSYSVSHDLRAPLRAIDGYTRILVEDYDSALDAEGQRVCGVIRRQTQRMGQLIDALLAFSRLSRTQMQTSLIDMEDLANAVFHELTTSEDRERIDFHMESLPPTMGDPTLIGQVWANLLTNAVKFSVNRERAVIEVSSSQDDGETIYSVRDNGAGFDMQYADKLFGVFQRLHSEREFEGTGVGLAIVQRIIHRHGGRVWAEAEVDKGATFYFTLPRKETP